MCGPTIHELRRDNTRLRKMFAEQELHNVDLHEDTLVKIGEITRLKQRIGELTREHREHVKEGESRFYRVNNKIQNLENLVGTQRKRLARMAKRLTGLAAERNELYLKNRQLDEEAMGLAREVEELHQAILTWEAR